MKEVLTGIRNLLRFYRFLDGKYISMWQNLNQVKYFYLIWWSIPETSLILVLSLIPISSPVREVVLAVSGQINKISGQVQGDRNCVSKKSWHLLYLGYWTQKGLCHFRELHNSFFKVNCFYCWTWWWYFYVFFGENSLVVWNISDCVCCPFKYVFLWMKLDPNKWEIPRLNGWNVLKSIFVKVIWQGLPKLSHVEPKQTKEKINYPYK